VELTEDAYRLLPMFGIEVLRTWKSDKLTATRTSRRKVVRGVPLHQYTDILRYTLQDMGGGAEARIGSHLYRRLRRQLCKTADDRKIVTSGCERWWNAMQWKRQAMVDAGELREDSKRGWWELA
jgi:hypothetical protein